MWPWRRSPSPDAAPRHAAAPAGDAGRPGTGGRPRGDWQLLAPIQRVTSEPELINPVARFQASLSAWQNPSMLEPLGHHLGAGEPSGVIADLATVRPEPVPARAPVDTPLPLAVSAPAAPAVQRTAATSAPTITYQAPAAEPVVSAVPVPAEVAGDVDLPMLTLPTVGRVEDGAPERDAAPASRGTGGTVDIAPVQRSVAPTLGDEASSLVTPHHTAGDTHGDATPGTPPDPAPVTPMPVATSGAGTPAGPTVMRIPSATTSGVPTGSVPADPPAGSPPPRRIGLGEPIVGGRGTPPVQRMPLATPPSGAPAPRSTSGAAPSTGTPSGVDAPLLGAWSPGDADDAPADDATASIVSGQLATTQVQLLAAETVAGYPTLALAPPAGSAAAPVPARPVVARLVGDAPPLVTPPEAPGYTMPPSATAYPGAPAGAPGTAGTPIGGGGAQPAVPVPGRGITVSRSVDPAVTPPRPAPVASLVYASGAVSGAPATPASRPGGIGGVPLSSLPIATATWVSPQVQRTETVEVRAAPPPPVAVQREEAPAADSGPASAPVEGTSTAPAAASTGGGNDTESLLAKLFDPLLSRLKTELRLDRERRGALTDLWH